MSCGLIVVQCLCCVCTVACSPRRRPSSSTGSVKFDLIWFQVSAEALKLQAAAGSTGHWPDTVSVLVLALIWGHRWAQVNPGNCGQCFHWELRQAFKLFLLNFTEWPWFNQKIVKNIFLIKWPFEFYTIVSWNLNRTARRNFLLKLN